MFNYLFLLLHISSLQTEKTYLSPLADHEPNQKTVTRPQSQNVYRTPKKYNTAKQLRIKIKKQKKNKKHKSDRKHTTDPFEGYPQSAKNADKYKLNKIDKLTKQDMHQLKQFDKITYEKVQTYLITLQAQIHNHCINIIAPKNRKQITVCLYTFHIVFRYFSYFIQTLFILYSDTVHIIFRYFSYFIQTLFIFSCCFHTEYYHKKH